MRPAFCRPLRSQGARAATPSGPALFYSGVGARSSTCPVATFDDWLAAWEKSLGLWGAWSDSFAACDKPSQPVRLAAITGEPLKRLGLIREAGNMLSLSVRVGCHHAPLHPNPARERVENDLRFRLVHAVKYGSCRSRWPDRSALFYLN